MQSVNFRGSAILKRNHQKSSKSFRACMRLFHTPKSVSLPAQSYQPGLSELSIAQYTQVARRLGCAVMIPPGALSHAGEHRHSSEEKPFHFCQARCGQCEYFCTLPLGSYASPTATFIIGLPVVSFQRAPTDSSRDISRIDVCCKVDGRLSR